MSERKRANLSELLVRSAVLDGIGHGFSTRVGGISAGRYATLNLGGKWGDDPAHVAENRRRLAAAGGFEIERLYTARQVHGARVLRVDEAITALACGAVEADALVSATAGTVLGIYTADCVPILIGDGAGRAAVVHAGWRGTVAGVARAAVAALIDLGAQAADLRAALGPSICAGCFEVGEEVAREFDRTAPAAVRRASGRKPHVDLWAANRAQLVAAGLDLARIDAAPPCTACEPARFFSYRRDGAGIGQQLSFVIA